MSEEVVESPDLDELRKKLEMPISSLSLGVRAYNCLDGESIHTVGQLVSWKESDLLKVRNFGQTTLDEIKLRLGEIGLNLGMDVPASSVPEVAPAHISPVISQDLGIAPPEVGIVPEPAISPPEPAISPPEPEIAPADVEVAPDDAESSLDPSAGTVQ